MVVDEIKKIEEDLKEGSVIKIKAEASLSGLRKEFNDINNEIKELGIVDVAKAEDELNEKKSDLANKVKELGEMIPSDIIEKFKNYDFTNDLPDPSMEF